MVSRKGYMFWYASSDFPSEVFQWKDFEYIGAIEGYMPTLECTSDRRRALLIVEELFLFVFLMSIRCVVCLFFSTVRITERKIVVH